MLMLIVSDPTCTSLQLLKKQVFANVHAVPTNLGSRQYGHLALLMTPTEYQVLPNTVPFPALLYPSPLPLHDQVLMMQFQLTQLNWVYNVQLTMFCLYHNVSKHLKKLILEAIDNKYLATLKDEMMGFATFTPHAMLVHLIDTYDPIKPMDLDTNLKKLSAPWMPKESVEDLWKHICNCQIFASASGEAITNTTAICLMLTFFGKTGTTINKWKDKLAVQQTMANFQAHFKEENDCHIKTLTSAQARFQHTNAVAMPPTSP